MKPKRKAVKWEYEVISAKSFRASILSNLLHMGGEGWELCHVERIDDEMALIFKRPINFPISKGKK